MTLEELYEAHEFNWAKVCLGLGIPRSTLEEFRRKGQISYRYQRLIESRSFGRFKADANEHSIATRKRT